MATISLTLPGVRRYTDHVGRVLDFIQRTRDAVRARAKELTAEPKAEREPLAMRGTPEIFFARSIDNSRLVKIADPRRSREMAQFAAAMVVLFAFAMLYAWQHFSAIEYGYRIEGERAQIQGLTEAQRELRLEQAALRDPQRIDQLARRMGLTAAQVGQFVPMEPQADEPGSPVLAQARTSATVAP